MVHTLESFSMITEEYALAIHSATKHRDFTLKGSQRLVSRLTSRGLVIDDLLNQFSALFGYSLFLEFAIGLYCLIFALFFGVITFSAFKEDK